MVNRGFAVNRHQILQKVSREAAQTSSLLKITAPDTRVSVGLVFHVSVSIFVTTTVTATTHARGQRRGSRRSTLVTVLENRRSAGPETAVGKVYSVRLKSKKIKIICSFEAWLRPGDKAQLAKKSSGNGLNRPKMQ